VTEKFAGIVRCICYIIEINLVLEILKFCYYCIHWAIWHASERWRIQTWKIKFG